MESQFACASPSCCQPKEECPSYSASLSNTSTTSNSERRTCTRDKGQQARTKATGLPSRSFGVTPVASKAAAAGRPLGVLDSSRFIRILEGLAIGPHTPASDGRAAEECLFRIVKQLRPCDSLRREQPTIVQPVCKPPQIGIDDKGRRHDASRPNAGSNRQLGELRQRCQPVRPHRGSRIAHGAQFGEQPTLVQL